MTLTPEMVEIALRNISNAQKVMRELDVGLRKARAQDWAGHGPHEMNVAGCLVRDEAWIDANAGLNEVCAMIRAQYQRTVPVAELEALVTRWSDTDEHFGDDHGKAMTECADELRALIDRAGGGV